MKNWVAEGIASDVNDFIQRPSQNENEPMDSQPIVSVYASNVEELVTQSTDESNPLNIMRSPIR